MLQAGAVVAAPGLRGHGDIQVATATLRGNPPVGFVMTSRRTHREDITTS
jgi:hypothetical protein